MRTDRLTFNTESLLEKVPEILPWKANALQSLDAILIKLTRDSLMILKTD